MARFFLNVHTQAGDFPDAQGSDFPSPAEAIEAANERAREMMADDIRKGEVCFSSYIDITDESGAHVSTVEFQQAVTIRL
jgi:hypothetical protein